MSSFFMGTPERFEQRSTLNKQQQPILAQQLAAIKGRGAGGAFGESSDYYRDLLSNDSQTFNQMAAPEMRRFNEQIVPDLAEQFAGYGSGGGVGSSGFRNASINAGTDLSERLGSIRAQLRQQGASGLSGMAQQGLNQYSENIYRPATQGFLSQLAPIVGGALGSFGGPGLGAGGAALGNRFGNWLNPGGSASPQTTQSGALK